MLRSIRQIDRRMGRITWSGRIGNQAQNAALKELIEAQSSDRVVGIVGGAILEDALQNALIFRFRSTAGHNTDLNDRLFRVGGPLGFFRPKIDIAYQLYVFDKPIRNAMYGIAEIRNLFAHQLDMNFSSADKRMTDAAAKLTLHQGRTHYPHPITGKDSEYEIEATSTTRDQFFVNLKLCLIWLMEDHNRHHTWTNIPMTWGPMQPASPDTPRTPSNPHRQ